MEVDKILRILVVYLCFLPLSSNKIINKNNELLRIIAQNLSERMQKIRKKNCMFELFFASLQFLVFSND